MTNDMASRLNAALADRYRVERELGAGGMATVYLAHDVRHDRDVAIKVLHPELAAALGGERFLSEIKTTARLQHPHILPLLDSGEADGLLYYVMPYVTGETLRARLERERQLPIDDALRIAREVADALGAAHALGIIHRDIKPENILLQGGHATVADFGIALAVQSAGGARMTQTGLSLGTPQYMSPEQAMGEKNIDLRSDIYALGAVTYEMVTGDPPFTGNTVQSIVAKVLTEKPTAPSAVRDTVSLAAEQAILRSLAKLPADRYGSAREFAEALDGYGVASASGTRVAAISGRTAARSVRAWQLTAGALLLVAIVATSLLVRARASARAAADAAPVIRARFDLPSGARIADALVGPTIAVSPAGDVIAFSAISGAGSRMYVRRVNELMARESASRAGRNLTFSPDGKWLAFTEGNVLRKIAVDGGEAITLGTTGGVVPYGLAWSERDTIYIGSFSGLYALPATGGAPAPMTVGAGPNGPRMGTRWPMLLPGGKAIAFTRGTNSSAAAQLTVLQFGTGRVTDYSLSLAMPLGVLDDHLVYVSAAGALMTVRVDPGTGRPLGEPLLLEDGILVEATSGSKAALSQSGTLVLIRGRAQFQPVLVSARGESAPLLDELRSYSTPRYSPDGRRVAFAVFSASSTDVFIYDEVRNTFSRLTTEGSNVRPEWTSDGKYVIFISDRGGRTGIWRQPSDGSGAAELLYEPEIEPFEAIVSPDMQTLVYRTAPGAKFPRDILAVPYAVALGATRPVTPLVTGPTTESLPRFSPDGKWLAYQSNVSGRFEIYVRPFPANAGPVQASNNGGTEALWGRDGKALYYRGPDGEVVQVAVSTGRAFTIGARKTVTTGEYRLDATHPDWDVAPDGRFLMLKRAGAESQMVVVHGWGRELRARVAARR